MSNIRIGGSKGVYLSLFEEKHTGKIVKGIENAVLHSFAVEMANNPGSLVKPGPDELERRARKAFEIVGYTRGDLGWGVDRIVSNLPRLLTAELNNISIDYENERKAWLAEDGATPGMVADDDFDLGI